MDITSTFDAKLEGLKASWSHGHLERSYTFCAEFRGYQMSRFTGDETIKYGEAFVRFYTQMGMDGLYFAGSIQPGETLGEDDSSQIPLRFPLPEPISRGLARDHGSSSTLKR